VSADLVLSDVRVQLGGRVVVQDVSLTLSTGKLVAIVGPNGAGKTSLVRAVAGLLRYRGRITFAGADLASLQAKARARTIAYLPQGHEVHWPLPARDIVALGRLPHGAADPARLGPDQRAAIDAAMALTGTAAFADRPVTELSGGERARVALARVFATGAPLVLADEPTAALDPRHQLDVMVALRGRADDGALAIAVTHDLGLAARFADQVVVMADGRVATAAPPAEALAASIMGSVFGVSIYQAEHQGRPVVVPWA
jgi:iron complex transport system ATP-binding protein